MDFDNASIRQLVKHRLETTLMCLDHETGRVALAEKVLAMHSQRKSRVAVLRKFGFEASTSEDEARRFSELYHLAGLTQEFSTEDPKDLVEDAGNFFVVSYWMDRKYLCCALNETAVAIASFRLFGPYAPWPHTMLNIARFTEAQITNEYAGRCGIYAANVTPNHLACFEGVVLILTACLAVKVALGRGQKSYAEWGCVLLLHNAHMTEPRGAKAALDLMEDNVAEYLRPIHYTIAREYRISFSSSVFNMYDQKAVRCALLKVVHARQGDSVMQGCGSLYWEASDRRIQEFVAELATHVARMNDPTVTNNPHMIEFDEISENGDTEDL